jgi:PPK2 family polyphosphate:nucleotide phosphotransferase
MTSFKQYRVEPGEKFKLKDRDTADTAGFKDRKEAKQRLAEGVEKLRDLQEKLYAHDRWALLLIFQAMDAAGKDSTIEHVMSGVNPQGCQVYSFKQPSSEELDHDYLWRTNKCLPERGRIGVFNRSYYEEVLVVRVHQGILAAEKLPAELVDKDIWKQRYKDINAYERYLAHNGIAILKFFLHVSKEEQRRRFLARLDEPEKNWKFNIGDLAERARWKDYMKAYEEAIQHTATPYAPWVVVPGNKKWFARIIVAATVVDALEELDLKYPKITGSKRRELEQGRKLLEKAVRKAGK